jgi:glycosyltransferase involved in cell wall biosynthesis
MPAYRSTAFITPVLESLAAQTYPNLEVLISVDQCSDGTTELCQAFAAAHSNVTVVRQRARLGWVGNSNALLQAAGGDYLFFAFHDDPLMPRYVERLVEALESNPRAVLAFSDVETNHGPMIYSELDGVTDRFERARRLLFVYGTWWAPLRGLMRRDAVRALGGMKRLAFGEFSTDRPWLLRLALLGEFVRVPEMLIHKEIRPAGLELTWRVNVLNTFAVALACAGVIRRAGFPLAKELYLYSNFGSIRTWLRRAIAALKRSGQPAR